MTGDCVPGLVVVGISVSNEASDNKVMDQLSFNDTRLVMSKQNTNTDQRIIANVFIPHNDSRDTNQMSKSFENLRKEVKKNLRQ